MVLTSLCVEGGLTGEGAMHWCSDLLYIDARQCHLRCQAPRMMSQAHQVSMLRCMVPCWWVLARHMSRKLPQPADVVFVTLSVRVGCGFVGSGRSESDYMLESSLVQAEDHQSPPVLCVGISRQFCSKAALKVQILRAQAHPYGQLLCAGGADVLRSALGDVCVAKGQTGRCL